MVDEAKLVEELHSLPEEHFRGAIQLFNITQKLPNTSVNSGEMLLQQVIYAPFSRLSMAATGGCHTVRYVADQDVDFSLSVESWEGEAFVERSLCIQPFPEEHFRGAIQLFNITQKLPNTSVNSGEMLLQQVIYAPFSRLSMAATGGCHTVRYVADQDVDFSLSVESWEGEAFVERSLCIQPDACITTTKSTTDV